MHIFGAIMTVVSIVGIICGCVLSLNKVRKLQDYNFKAKNPTAYNKVKSDIKPYIIVGVGIFAFVIGFICLNFA